MKTKNKQLICEDCGKDCSKYKWGGSTNHVWCANCYKKHKNTQSTSIIKKNSAQANVQIKSQPIQTNYVPIINNSPVNSNNESVDMTKFIPLNDGYIARKIKNSTDLKILNIAYNKAIKDFVMIVGETGTGKTSVIRHFSYTKKLPYARISLNGGATTDELIGHWIPSSDGKFKWQDGLLTLFVRNGGVVVLDEVNSCPADILFCLHSLTDDERTLTLLDKDSEVLHAHPNFFLVTTFNPDYEGTKPLNEAFKDRFKVKLNFEYNEKIEKQLIQSEDILKLAEKLRIIRAKNEISTPISTRMLIFYEQNTKEYGKELALEFFLNNFENYEREPIKNVLEMIEKGEDINDTDTLNQLNNTNANP